MLLFWLLYIVIIASFPILYIIGIVSLIRYLLGNKQKSANTHTDNRTQTLKIIISDLKHKLTENNKSVLLPLIQEYQNELQGRLNENINANIINKDESIFTKPHPVALLSQDVTSASVNWQSLSSINMLLYLGAFLIISSAAIFVAFQWETIAGITKAMLLTLVTLAFFMSGYWFYQRPKIKQAGITFIAIASILLPV